MKLKLSPDVLALNPGMGASIAVEGDKRASQRTRLPRAEAAPRTGLTPLLVRGWSVQSNGEYVRLYKLHEPLMDTGRCTDEKHACQKAKELEVQA